MANAKVETLKRRVSKADWLAQARVLFGPNPRKWAFECPLCGNRQTMQDFIDAGVDPQLAYVNCAGRYTGYMNVEMGTATPCNYTGLGLFRLNPVTVVAAAGEEYQVFEFARESEALT